MNGIAKIKSLSGMKEYVNVDQIKSITIVDDDGVKVLFYCPNTTEPNRIDVYEWDRTFNTIANAEFAVASMMGGIY